MLRKLMLSALAGGAGLALVGFALTSPRVSAEQDEAAVVEPFTLTTLNILSDYTAGGETLRFERLFARNSKGSTVEVREHSVPGMPGSRILIDIERGRRVVIEPITRSVTTYGLPDTATQQSYDAARCAHTGERQQVMGVDVYKAREVRSFSAGRGMEAERWIAPSVGCIVLSEVVTQTDNGTVVSRQSVEVVSLFLGSPLDELFEVPLDFVERSPSQVTAERARLYPDLCPECTEPSARLSQQDAAYFNSRP